jgi:putative FmdB family regulatory protein
MPLYEYECNACDHRFERIQKFSDPPVDVCPSCNGAVRKLISSPAIQFKGSGWYVTDYAKSGATSESDGDGAKADSGSAEKADKTGKDGKTDGKTSKESAAKATDTSKDAGKTPASTAPRQN